jgi:cardiolipin synthase
VCLETYILRDDATGQRFAEVLCARAREGVEVSVLYDAWGSSVSEAFLARLAEAGVRTASFRPFRFKGSLGRALARFRRRNHRKLLVVDGQVAFTGGLNIADEYAPAEAGGGDWRDTHVRLVGPTALRLQALFLRTWKGVGGAALTPSLYLPPPREAPGALWVVTSGWLGEGRRIRALYLRAIHAAQERIVITNAYFVPTARLLRALLKAARRGVRVELILAGLSDVPAVRLASRHLYERLLRAGVRLYEFRGRVLHAKTAVVDGLLGTVGSSNLDALSLSVNLELNVAVVDAAFGRALERMAAEDMACSEEVHLERWQRRPLLERILSWGAFHLRRWL